MMLVFTVTLRPNLIAGGVLQLVTEVISSGQAMGFSLPFAILTLIAIWLTVILFRNFSDVVTGQLVIVRTAHA